MMLSVVACKKDTKEKTQEIISENEISNLTLVTTSENSNYSIEIYTSNGKISKGYNELFFRFKNKTTGEFVQPSSLNFNTEMDMGSMQHGSPVSTITKVPNKKNLYSAFAIFQMASMQVDDWSLNVNVTIQQQNFVFYFPVNVQETAKVTCQSFTGSDSKKYVIAMVNPKKPAIGPNVISARIFEMVNMHQFDEVNHFQLQIDPRMPSMGNHSSPNNVHMVQTDNAGEYKGSVSFSMSGYWKINLKLLDGQQTTLKGEEVTTSNEASSIYFEVEF